MYSSDDCGGSLTLSHTQAFFFLVLGYTSSHQFNSFPPTPCLFCVIIRDVDSGLIQKTTQTVSSTSVNYRCARCVSKLTLTSEHLEISTALRPGGPT